MGTEQNVYADLGAMMQASADAAVAEAEQQYGFVLDYSEASLQHLDPILAQAALSKHLDVERETKLWGSYFGETVLRLYGGEWQLTLYPQSAAQVPTLIVRGAQLYPLIKVYRRLTLGEAERMDAFYAMVKQRLEALPQV